MKKIYFNYTNELNPVGVFEEIGIIPGVLLTDAEYYGAIKFDGNSYVIARVGEDKYTQFSKLAGKFIVRDSFLDVYADGSTILYLDQEQSSIASKLEEYINYMNLETRIDNIDDIINLSDNLEKPNPFYKLLDEEESIVSISIIHEAFIEKREAMKKCKRSFSNVQLLLKRKTFNR